MKLLAFLPEAGQELYDPRQDETELKMNNPLMGQSVPVNWPLGNVDNRIWLQNMAREGLVQMPELNISPVYYMGGNLRPDYAFGDFDVAMPMTPGFRLSKQSNPFLFKS